MKLTSEQLWQRFQRYWVSLEGLDMSLDISRVDFPDDHFAQKDVREAWARAWKAMQDLEGGSLANTDERRQVGHYWLRDPELAPNDQIKTGVKDTIQSIKTFAKDVHEGRIAGQRGPFRNLLVIGIGGSALGPQLASRALGHPLSDRMNAYFFDNTDPDGMDHVLQRMVAGSNGPGVPARADLAGVKEKLCADLAAELGQTLCVIISKSGDTRETRNGLEEIREAYRRHNLDFTRHAVAVTVPGWNLDKRAVSENWLARFATWDWVGGRTSQTSAVGLLPAALQGFDIDGLLRGARLCDQITRGKDLLRNPAALLALLWHRLGDGKGNRDMVVLPYKDRLEWFPRYLQQLVMESLGKEVERDGRRIHQGLTVYGNKGSTDQHSYVQQLRDGPDNFFVTFIEVLEDRAGGSLDVEAGVTSGDYLSGFLLGTRNALYDQGRQSITLTVREVSPMTLGALIALFERAVGYYASLIQVNAYHQPGVQAGKVGAETVIKLQATILKFLATHAGVARTAAQLAKELGTPEQAETIFKICEHLAANRDRGISVVGGDGPARRYQAAHGRRN